ncbi:hypothetical protein HG530_002652 [Fusarium avenaceum]|nr:hypothetical protein HG530_002652 [Fusarium avenaceum]
MTEESGEEIVRRTPERENHAVEDNLDLVLESLLDISEFSTVVPDVGPVTVSNTGSAAGTDSLEHVLSNVGFSRRHSTVALEIASQNMSILADVAEVDSTASTLEEKKAIEVLEECRVGLMDGAQNSLA